MQITNKCLPSILKLQHLEDLILEGCFGIDDCSLAALKHGCKSLKVRVNGKTCSLRVGREKRERERSGVESKLEKYFLTFYKYFSNLVFNFRGAECFKLTDFCALNKVAFVNCVRHMLFSEFSRLYVLYCPCYEQQKAHQGNVWELIWSICFTKSPYLAMNRHLIYPVVNISVTLACLR